MLFPSSLFSRYFTEKSTILCRAWEHIGYVGKNCCCKTCTEKSCWMYVLKILVTCAKLKSQTMYAYQTFKNLFKTFFVHESRPPRASGFLTCALYVSLLQVFVFYFCSVIFAVRKKSGFHDVYLAMCWEDTLLQIVLTLALLHTVWTKTFRRNIKYVEMENV